MNLKCKLRNKAGETIAETLIALLIAAIALTMLAAMIASTVNVVTVSKDKIEEYYEKSVPLEQMVAEGTGGSSATVAFSAGNLSAEAEVVCYTNETFNSTDKAVSAYIIKPES